MNRKWTYYFLSAVIILSVGYSQKVPSPQDVFGFRIGDDYKLADHRDRKSTRLNSSHT